MVEASHVFFSRDSGPPHCSVTAMVSAGQRSRRASTPRAKRRIVGEVGDELMESDMMRRGEGDLLRKRGESMCVRLCMPRGDDRMAMVWRNDARR